MRIKSTEALKELFDILDDGDCILAKDIEYDIPYIEAGPYESDVNIFKVPLYTISFGGKSIHIRKKL